MKQGFEKNEGDNVVYCKCLRVALYSTLGNILFEGRRHRHAAFSVD